MPTQRSTEPALTPELEAIATAAAELRQANDVDSTPNLGELQARLREAATTAIAAGVELEAIVHAQTIGHTRARQALGSEMIRRVERAARRRREIDREYSDAVIRAARLGLAHRDIAAAAGITHGTVRAIVARTPTPDDAQRDTEAEHPADTTAPTHA